MDTGMGARPGGARGGADSFGFAMSPGNPRMPMSPGGFPRGGGDLSGRSGFGIRGGLGGGFSPMSPMSQGQGRNPQLQNYRQNANMSNMDAFSQGRGQDAFAHANRMGNHQGNMDAFSQGAGGFGNMARAQDAHGTSFRNMHVVRFGACLPCHVGPLHDMQASLWCLQPHVSWGCLFPMCHPCKLSRLRITRLVHKRG